MFCLYNNGCCGFVSLYYALKFEKEDLLKKYNIDCVEDLYNLFMNEVIDKYKHQPFLNILLQPISIEYLFLWKHAVYKTEKNIIEKNACSAIYFGMMAKYLNIHIKLIEIESSVSYYDNMISNMSKINKQIINPECVVSIHLSGVGSMGHAEYIGKNDLEKKEIYEFEKHRELIKDDIDFCEHLNNWHDDENDDDFLKDFEQDIQDINNYYKSLCT